MSHKTAQLLFAAAAVVVLALLCLSTGSEASVSSDLFTVPATPGEYELVVSVPASTVTAPEQTVSYPPQAIVIGGVQVGTVPGITLKAPEQVVAVPGQQIKVKVRVEAVAPPVPEPEPTPEPEPPPVPQPPEPPPSNIITVAPVSGDAQPVIQAAVDSLAAKGGGIVQLTAGTYALTAGRAVNPNCGANVNVRSGVHIVGAGIGKTIVKPQTPDRHPFASYLQTDMGISDMTIIGNGQSAAQDGCKFYDSSQVTVHNIEVSNIYIGLALYGCRDSVVSDCYVHDCGMGIAPSEPNRFCQPTFNVTVERCRAVKCGTGFRASGYAPGEDSDAVSRVSDVTLTDCVAENCSGFGYLYRYAQRLTVTRCAALNMPRGHFLNGVLDSVFTGCTPRPTISTSKEDVSRYGASVGVVIL